MPLVNKTATCKHGCQCNVSASGVAAAAAVVVVVPVVVQMVAPVLVVLLLLLPPPVLYTLSKLRSKPNSCRAPGLLTSPALATGATKSPLTV